MRAIVETIIILVMSFNIRYLNPNDGINNWDNRKEMVVNLIKQYSPDLLGLQEVRGAQLDYLEKQLTDYAFTGEPRTEDPDDERTPIFFKKEKFELIDSNTFWLSETPGEPSIGWDAALNRIITWGKLKERETGKIIFYFNTHFDNKGEVARLKSAELLRKKIKEIAGEENYIITGDFNLSPSSKIYEALTSSDTSLAFLADVGQFSEETRSEIKGTFNNFDTGTEPVGPIDYIFVKPTFSVKSFKVVDTLINGRYPSDHFPVKAELEMRVK